MSSLSPLRPAQVAADRKRLEEKILTLMFKARDGLCPSYLADLNHVCPSSYAACMIYLNLKTGTKNLSYFVPTLQLRSIHEQTDFFHGGASQHYQRQPSNCERLTTILR